jgi:hypothetical protein
MDNPSIHDFIMGRTENSDPHNDLLQIGFDGQAIYEQLLANPLLTVMMFGEMIAATGPRPDVYIADYAMTWFTIGACLTEEKHARAAADNLPPPTNEPT